MVKIIKKLKKFYESDTFIEIIILLVIVGIFTVITIVTGGPSELSKNGGSCGGRCGRILYFR